MGKRERKAVTAEERAAFIIRLFREQPERSFTPRQAASASGGDYGEGLRTTGVILKQLAAQGLIVKTNRKYRLARRHQPLYTGRLEYRQSGFVVVTPDCDRKIIISPRNCRTALEGDMVEVALLRRTGSGGVEGEVRRVTERSGRVYSGVTETVTTRTVRVRIDSRRMPQEIALSRKDYPDLTEGKRVTVSVVKWDDEGRLPDGRLEEVLGEAGDNNAEMHAIMAEFGLPYRFDAKTEEAARGIATNITPEERAARRDMREVPTFTIDPDDAKDFDDALSLRPAGEGLWEVGVHIADVSHYVQPGSALDNEARERGTSVYLVDRTIPMLPESLSNALCSLRPHEEKLCFSAVFTIADDMTVREEWFGRTVIRSDRRFTYGEAQRVIESGEGDMKEEIAVLNRLAKGLRHERIKNGALVYERREAKFDLDGEGRPLGISFKEAGDANHLIEEFMLLANREVARFCSHTRSGRLRTMVYRVHDKPDAERLEKFRSFIRRYGLKFNAENGTAVKREINDILSRTKGMPEENTVSLLAIRSMAKAEYSTDNIGHYGLGFRYYTHFTSPIRRYPDILAHRLLAHYLDGGRTADAEELELLCRHSSERETLAAEAERASVKYKIAEYMSTRQGEVFDGHISGVTEWGMYIELEDSIIEGTVHLRDMGDDYYWFDYRNQTIYGRATGKTFTLGDTVKVRVRYADMRRRMLEFEIVQ